MADEYVSGAQFGEFVKRMEERFDHAEELAKEREDKLNLRFDAQDKRFDARFDAIDKRINDLWKVMVVVLGGILAGAVAAVAKAFL
jgi:hypothetical protein